LHHFSVVEAVAPLTHHTILRAPFTLRRYAAVALCSVLALALPTTAGAEPLRADLEGDGVHDRSDPEHQPGLLAARLSRTRHWLRVEANDPIIRIVVVDIDRDGDSDVVAETRHSGLYFWINQGRGRFAFRSPHARLRPLRAQRVFRIVSGLQILHEDNSALNDPNRLLAVVPSPLADVLVAAGPTPLAANPPPGKFTHCRSDARGPPHLARS
jgi:hypothetical protein